MSNLCTTDVVPQPERLNYWRELVSETYVGLQVEKRESANFFGEINMDSVGQLDFSEIRASGQHVIRTSRAIRQSTMDYFIIIAQLEGTGLITQDAKETKLQVGDWSLIDTTRPYEFTFEGAFKHQVLSVPRSAMPQLIGQAKYLTARNLRRLLLLGPIVSDYLLSLSGLIHKTTVDSRVLLAESLLNLLCATVYDAFPNAKADSNSFTIQQERIKAFVMRCISEYREVSQKHLNLRQDLANECLHRRRGIQNY